MTLAPSFPVSNEAALAAERSILAAMLLDTEAIAKARAMFDGCEFYDNRICLTFRAIVALSDQGDSIDLITLGEELIRRGDLGAVGGHPFLARIMECATTAAKCASSAPRGSGACVVVEAGAFTRPPCGCSRSARAGCRST